MLFKAVDEYHQQLNAYEGQDEKAQLNNPVFHIHGHNVPNSDMVVSSACCLTLQLLQCRREDQLWGFY